MQIEESRQGDGPQDREAGSDAKEAAEAERESRPRARSVESWELEVTQGQEDDAHRQEEEPRPSVRGAERHKVCA